MHGSIPRACARCVHDLEDNTKKITGKTDYLDVYEKRKGRWVAIAAHVTYLGNN
jgi:hypothetical protein